MANPKLNKYLLSFRNEITDIANIGKIIIKLAGQDNPLANFLNEWNDVEEINQELLPTISETVNGLSENTQTGSEIFHIEVFYDVTKFFIIGSNHNLINSVFEIPTLDFKLIIELWRDFLLQPPLHGSKV